MFKAFCRRYPHIFAHPNRPGKTISHRHFLRKNVTGNIERSRLEAFSDGVFAIAATFQFLEIPIPSPNDENMPSFQEALQNAGDDIGAYLISFGVLGLLWINHRTIVEDFHHVPRLIRFLNTQHLALVAILPLFFSLLINFWEDKHALLWTACAVGITGLAQFLTWGAARLKHRYSAVSIDEAPLLHIGPMDAVRLPYKIAQLLVIPAVSFATAAVSPITTRVHLFLLLAAPISYCILGYLDSRASRAARDALTTSLPSQHTPLIQ